MNGPPVPGAGRGGACSQGTQAWCSRGMERARPSHAPSVPAPSVLCLAAPRSQRPSLPLTGVLPQDPRGRGSLAERREEDLGGKSENAVLAPPPPCGRGRGPGAALASGQTAVT